MKILLVVLSLLCAPMMAGDIIMEPISETEIDCTPGHGCEVNGKHIDVDCTKYSLTEMPDSCKNWLACYPDEKSCPSKSKPLTMRWVKIITGRILCYKSICDDEIELGLRSDGMVVWR